MSRVILILILAILAVAFAIHQQDDARSQQAWKHFKDRYGKRYGVLEEKRRYGFFVKNLKRADNLNAHKENRARWGVTQFMDLSPAEFRNTYLMNETKLALLGKPKNAAVFPKAPPRSPMDFDWSSKGAVTPVKNQEQCGSCWAFSAAETVESAWFIAGNALTLLSEQQIVDCDTTCYGCDGGWTYLAFQYLIQTGGDDTEASYPYNAVTDPTCQFNSQTIGATISSWAYVTQNCDETQMANFLYSTQPISVCVDAETWQYYQGGIVTAANCGTSIDHCVQITGVITEDGCQVWNVRNSWGATWGENGYLWVQMNTNACAIAEVATGVTV